jgi:hypothetical protein
MNRKKQMILFFILLCPSLTFAQSAKPQWMSTLPAPHNSTYKFVRVTGIGSALHHAELACIDKLSTDEALIRSVDINKVATIDRETQQKFENGKLNETTRANTNVTVQIKGMSVRLQAKLVDEYSELISVNGKKEYKVTALYMVGLQSDPVFDDVTTTSKYGARGLLRSAVVPGWGQFYKGSNLKGGLILGGEAALAGGILASENLRASYVKKMKEQPQHIQTYNSKADNWENIRNVCIGGAAALYVYNLIDAIAADGGKRIIVNKKSHFSFQPVMNTEYSGLAIAFNF